jgi:RsiW-degrading membrane proteinase PrsW (M82 family)/CRP-like cAMP-binding protein
MTTTELLAYVLAVAIPVFYIYIIFTLDFFGTTKRSIILFSALWGAIGAFGLAYIVNSQMATIMGWALVTGLTAPSVEEILKASFLAYYVQRPAFRYVVDGAVYGFSVGIGFAAIENISYISNDVSGGTLSLAVSRVLSTALMHAVASGIVGLSLGALRRVRTRTRQVLNYAGILVAMVIHIVFNNLVQVLEGPLLLLVAIGFGIGGGVLLAFLINQQLEDEKERFQETLGLHVGVSEGERMAVQSMATARMESVFKLMEEDFGPEKVELIRRLLATQANIGILQNNLKSPSGERLRKAWEEEIAELQEDVKQMRKKLDYFVAQYIDRVFPAEDNQLLQEELGRLDPSLVHTFDMFMRLSDLSRSYTPEQLEEMADQLAQIDIFKNVPTGYLENLSRAIKYRTFEDGEMLFDQGTIGDTMYLVKAGEIEIILVQVDKTERSLKFLGPGKVVGEFAVLDGETRSARAKAKGQLTVGILQRQAFLRFIQSRPQVIMAMLQVLAEKARYTTKSVEESIKFAQYIANGEYHTLQMMAAERLDAENAAMHQKIDPTKPLGTIEIKTMFMGETETVEMNEKTADKLCQAFAKAAMAIDVQERQLKRQLIRPATES